MTVRRSHGARARRASSTSAASAPRSSTGSSRDTRAASSGCASRTRTRAARSTTATEQIQESLRWLGLDWDGERHLPARPHGALPRGGAAPRRRGQGLRGRGRDPHAHARRGRDCLGRPRSAAASSIRTRSSRTSSSFAPTGGRPTTSPRRSRTGSTGSRTSCAATTTSRTRRSRSRSSRRSARHLPEYGHLANILGPDGKKLSKRHGATSVEEFREQGYLPEALVNFLALLGWSYDDKTTVMSRDELVERFTLERVGASPAVFDFQKLDWLNGVYLRELPPDEYADRLVAYLREQGLRLGRGARPQGGAARPGEDRDARRVPGVRRLPLRDGGAGPGAPRRRRARACRADAGRRRAVHAPSRSSRRSAALAERLELKPREAFQPIRVAVTGSKVSPGLFESIELLGRERDARAAQAAPGGKRLRRRERVERALELAPGAAPEARRRRGPPEVDPEEGLDRVA